MTSKAVDGPDEGQPRNRRAALWRRLWRWAGGTGLSSRLALLLTIAAVIAGVATFWALTENPTIGGDPDTVYLLLNIDLVILLLLGAVVARRLLAIYLERRRGQAGARLHIRLAARFSLVAIVPAIIVATFSAFFFHFGIQSWFSERIQTAVNESLSAAEAYLEEHQQAVQIYAMLMAQDINRQANRAMANPDYFDDLLSFQAGSRDLTEAVVISGDGQVLASSRFNTTIPFRTLTEEVREEASASEPVLLSTGTNVRVVVRLPAFPEAYLVVGRTVTPQIINHMERAQGAVAEYQQLQERAEDLQIAFTAIYILVALLLLLVSVWFGLVFADSLVAPIGQLIAASRSVGEGNLQERVPVSAKHDELASLARSFNNMTDRLESQQRRLVEANEELEERSRFTEAVLTGVSAGVIGLDRDGLVTLPNRSAADLLGLSASDMTGRPLHDVVPEMSDLLERARRLPRRLHEGQVSLRREGGERTLLVRVATERTTAGIVGYVVTFDDISELLSAQRKAAWADVARRIAHEIKNPLTPIQLSAERLKRRYLKQVKEDPDTFVACTDTIVRQVGDIGRMVDEFSAFARMPSPVMQREDLGRLVREAVDFQRHAYSRIEFDLALPDQPVHANCDRRQISQLLTNVLQNAIDAIDGRVADDGEDLPRGRVGVSVERLDDHARIVVEDNGRGLPDLDHERLTEPYVTTRDKGTGLGLAIVKKIIEDHRGHLAIEDRSGGGARVTISLSLTDGAAGDGEATETTPAEAKRERQDTNAR